MRVTRSNSGGVAKLNCCVAVLDGSWCNACECICVIMKKTTPKLSLYCLLAILGWLWCYWRPGKVADNAQHIEIEVPTYLLLHIPWWQYDQRKLSQIHLAGLFVCILLLPALWKRERKGIFFFSWRVMRLCASKCSLGSLDFQCHLPSCHKLTEECRSAVSRQPFIRISGSASSLKIAMQSLCRKHCQNSNFRRTEMMVPWDLR